MTSIERVEGMSLDEFKARMSDKLNQFEIIDGEIIPVSITSSGHNRIAMLLLFALYQYAVPKNLGEAMMEMVFALTSIPKWVTGSRSPDVMFYQAHRLDAYRKDHPDWRDDPYFLVPDLVAEIISANDSARDVLQKVVTYLHDGVQVVWVIDPVMQRVIVYHADNIQTTTLTATDSLDGGAVVPGFSMSVAALFA